MVRRVLGLVTAVAVFGGLFVGLAAANPDAVQYTGCLTDKGDLTKIAEGDQPVEPCKEGKEVQAAWNSEGPQGLTGVNGADGQDGVDGQNGTDGDDGSDGLDGLQGPKGDPGDPCTVNEDPPGTYSMTCSDESSVQWHGITGTTNPPSPWCDVTVRSYEWHQELGPGEYELTFEWNNFGSWTDVEITYFTDDGAMHTPNTHETETWTLGDMLEASHSDAIPGLIFARLPGHDSSPESPLTASVIVRYTTSLFNNDVPPHFGFLNRSLVLNIPCTTQEVR